MLTINCVVNKFIIYQLHNSKKERRDFKIKLYPFMEHKYSKVSTVHTVWTKFHKTQNDKFNNCIIQDTENVRCKTETS